MSVDTYEALIAADIEITISTIKILPVFQFLIKMFPRNNNSEIKKRTTGELSYTVTSGDRRKSVALANVLTAKLLSLQPNRC